MILVEKPRKLDIDPDSSEQDEYETTNEDEYSDDEEIETQDTDKFLQFPSLGLNNYLNNLNLNFNLNLNNRLNAFVSETTLWKLYENSQLPAFPQFPPIPNLPNLPNLPRFSNISKPRESLGNLWKQLADEEYEAQLKRQQFKKVQQKACAEVRRRLEPKIKRSREKHLLKSRRDSLDKDTTPLEDTEIHAGGDGRWLRSEGDRDDSVGKRLENMTDVDNGDVPKLDEEFWSQFFGFSRSDSETELVEEGGGTTPQPKPPVNPFYNRLYLTAYDKIKLFLLAIVFVFRVLGILVCLTLACVLAFIGTIGLTFEEANSAPLAKWRRVVRWIDAHVVMRTMWFFCGFVWVRRIGKQASPKEAQVYVVAPHSSYFDAFAVTYLGGPSVVAKHDAGHLPFFGRLINFTQPIYVKREDRSSRSTCVKEIERRILSTEEWPQVFIFPEGTCTNRSALAQFKNGAFLAGVPVQPVAIRYPNRVDSVTWTFDGPTSLRSAYISMTQFYNSIEIEFLPVYVPNQIEKQDPGLFARNVQKVMADALGVPATEFSMEDGNVLTRISQTKIRHKLETIWKIKGDLNLRDSPTETTLVYEGTTNENFRWKIGFQRFQEFFHIQSGDVPNPEVQDLFNLFTQGSSELIDLRAYLLLACFMYSDAKLDLLITLMFKMYAGSKKEMSQQEFLEFMQNVFESAEKEAIDLFKSVDRSSTNPNADSVRTITFDNFQRKIRHRVEYVKLYAMEETGQLCGNFPLRSQRDQRPLNEEPEHSQSKSKTD